MYQYFKDVANIDELKKKYRKLAKKYHPDMGGNDEEMKIINKEYDRLFKELKTFKDKDDNFKDIIQNIINLPLEIEICGSWIWVSGDTRSYKDKLKEAGFKWASKKKMWFWKPDDHKTKKRSNTPMDQIREKYGSQKVKFNPRLS